MIAHGYVAYTHGCRWGDMTRAQVDDAEIAARMRWNEFNPGSARLRKLAPSSSRTNGDRHE